jgi:hypothetical protein
MKKTTVTRLFVSSLIALIVGIILVAITAGLAFADDALIVNGAGVATVQENAIGLPLFVLGLFAAMALVTAAVLGVVSWIGALLTTWRLDSKAWFIALLLLGIFNFGWLAMIAYVFAGPDGVKAGQPQRAPAPA